MTELNIISDMNQNLPQTPPTTASSVRVKAPRRILHFSDGTLEEYSTDDEPDSPDNSNQNKQIDLVSFVSNKKKIVSSAIDSLGIFV